MVEKFQRDTTDLFNYPSDENPTTQADYISAVKNWQETERNLVDSVLWQPDTDYAIGAVVKTPSIPSQYILVCTQAGTSGTEEPDYTDVSTGYSVSDGTAIWRVETIVSLDKVNDMFANIIELIESGEALTGDMWSLDIEENMVANKDNIVPKTNGVSKLGTAEKRWGEIHVVTPTKGDNSEKVATTAYVQAELEDYLTLMGGTITGNLFVSGTITGNLVGNADTATNATNATNDGNGNEIAATYLPLAGGTMTGNITLADGGNPLSTAGGTMTGTLTLADGGRALSDATVGTVVSNTSNNVSVGNTAKSIVSISLSAGTWVVTGTVGYANIVATRMMIGLNTAVELYANTEGTTSIHSGATSSNPVGLTTTRIFVLNATSTVHLLGYVQGSTSVNATTNTIRAVRIK